MTHIQNNIQYKIYFGYMLPTGEWCNVCLGVSIEGMTSSMILNGKHFLQLITGV